MQREFVDEVVLFKRGQYHVLMGDRLLSLSPSPGGRLFYLCVYKAGDPDTKVVESSWGGEHQRSLNRKGNGEKVWPTDYEKACGYWAAATQGFTTLILKTPDGERHIKI